MKKKYFFIEGARQWNKLLKRYLNLYGRIRSMKGDTEQSEHLLSRMIRKLQMLYKRLEKMQYRVGVKLAGTSLALMLAAATASSQDLTQLDNLSYNSKGVIKMNANASPYFADIDGDGDEDLLTGSLQGDILLYEREGNAFRPAVNVQVGGIDANVPRSTPTMADFDDDGDLDLFTGCDYGYVYLYENLGDGSFDSKTVLQVGGSNLDVGTQSKPAFFDLDSDHDMDLLVGSQDGTIEVFDNDGGTFTSLGNLQAGGSDLNVTNFALADFADLDEDGDKDLYVGGYYYIYAFLNDGNNNFSSDGYLQADESLIYLGPYPACPAFTDLDGDGDTDMLLGEKDGYMTEFTNNEGAFTEEAEKFSYRSKIALVQAYPRIDAGDIDGDGDEDLVVASSSKFYLYENEEELLYYGLTLKDASNQDLNLYRGTPALVDMDNDGDLDLVSGSYYDGVKYYNNENGAFMDQGSLTDSEGNPIGNVYNSSPAFGDMDNDGDLDLVVGDYNGYITYYENDGGSFVNRGYLQVDGANLNVPTNLAANPIFADLDYDGDPDLYVGTDQGRIIMYENNDGAFQTGVNVQVDGADIDEGTNIELSPAFINFDNGCGTDLIVGHENDYVLHFDYVDASGPVPDEDPLRDIIGECQAIVSDAPTATDNCSGTVTATTTDPLNYSEQGTYTVIWVYEDGNGFTTEQTQTVIVDDVSGPVPDVTTLPEVTGECSAEVTTTPTATDDCTGEQVNGTTDDALSYSSPGNYTITWSYADSYGNVSTQEQTVTVTDEVLPEISCISNTEVEISGDATGYTVDGTEFDPVDVRDNCETYTLSNSFDDAASLAGAEFSTGDYTIVWTVMDEAGNEASCSFDLAVGASVNVQEMGEIPLQVYPNPAGSFIHLNAEILIEEVELYDLAGRVVKKETLNAKQLEVDIADLSPGIYILKAKTAEGVHEMKVIKE